METTGIPVELTIKISEALNGYDMDDVIPALTFLLARIGSSVCEDRDVFIGYVTSVIDEEYDDEGETLQ